MTENSTHFSLPEAVVARQITEDNLREIAQWTEGRVLNASVIELDAPDKKLCVELRQTNYVGEDKVVLAWVGDWVVLHEQSRFMVYTDRYFSKKFSDEEKPLRPFIMEFVLSAMHSPTPEWTKETFECISMDISNAICAASDYYYGEIIGKPDPLKILVLVKEAMVAAIEVMTSTRINEADTMNRMNVVASDYARKIASIV